MRALISTLRRSALAACLLCLSLPVVATLGEDVGSARIDQLKMQATLEISGAAGFSLHEIRLPSGTVVKEYVSPAGMVFAVSWQGPTLPDLQQVLGRYFEAYAAAVRSRGVGPGSQRPRASGLVVQSGGHMRAFFGRAYLQQWLPSGVLAEEIR